MQTDETKKDSKELISTRGTYRIFGSAQRGGTYNSHLVSAVIFCILGALELIPWILVAWVLVCLLAGIQLDPKPLKAKIRMGSIAGQVGLYIQVLLQAMLNALPWYWLAFGLYLCLAPFLDRLNLGISTFFFLYGFYIIDRVVCLVLHLIRFARDAKQEDIDASFYQGANLKDRSKAKRHVFWAFFIGNVGLVIRCSTFLLTISLFEMGRQFIIQHFESPQFTTEQTIFTWLALIVFVAALMANLKSAMVIYYRTHRTFHENLPLYDSIHAVHHRGVYPTRLDSGTISPVEFFITEMAFPFSVLVPNWWWVGAQIVVAYLGHFPGHNAKNRNKLGEHHLDHHRFLNVNFGLRPAEDEEYGTMNSG